MLKHPAHSICLFAVLFILTACSHSVQVSQTLTTRPPITPDYTDVTVPSNIAPLSFTLPDSIGATDLRAIFKANGRSVTVAGIDNQIAISSKDWKDLLQTAAGHRVEVTVQARINAEWIAYQSFPIYVSADPADPYIAYRLIEPGYEIWNEMGIYQRCIENYDETAILTNRMTDYGCMNCHSFKTQDPATLLFHLRADHGGTYLLKEGKMEKLNTKTPQTISALVYPSWHPSGNWVAFSVNNTKQMFHTTDKNRVEVFDLASDVVVYDVNKHEIFTSPLLNRKAAFETFPTFSPDGKTLYFCSANSVSMPLGYKEVKYSLCSLSFDPDTQTFGNTVDTLFNARTQQKSVSFPRVSPDGKFLMFTLSDYGNFSIWHRESDLYLLNTSTREITNLEALNSDDVDSYHSWSSNSRWILFSSRRIDGLYTRLYIAHIDENGKPSKPFLLPQKDPEFYTRFMKSYNVPEFIKGKVETQAFDISELAKKEAGINLSFRPE